MGGVAVDKGSVRYASPAPGTHDGNDFYITSGTPCDPPVIPPLKAEAIPFLIPIAQFPVIALPQSDLRGTRIEVNQAIQEKERAINDAWADYNKSVPKAKGEADQAIRSAEGYALERVNKAEGDASRFNALYEEYRKAPVVTRKRIYLETLAQVLPRIEKKVVLDDKAKGILPLLQLEGGTREIKP